MTLQRLLALSAALSAVSFAAQMTLTNDGKAAGLSISTFIDGFTPGSNQVGPRGIVYPDSGGVLVSHADGGVRKFSTTDGQHAGTVAAAKNFGVGNAAGLVKAAGKIYLAQPNTSQLTSMRGRLSVDCDE